MRLVDPSIELVACGSSSSTMPTFGAWEATVLEHTYELVDYLSMHAYYEEVDGDLGTFLASAVDLDRSIDAVVAIIDRVAAKVGSRKQVRIAFDEWNVWYMRRFDGRQGADWSVAPAIIEDDYSVADAVVVGDLLLTLLRHADRVAIACLAQLVNVIAPIRTTTGGPAWRQTTFHPFAITARRARGIVLRADVSCPTYPTVRYGDVPVLSAAAVLDEDAQELVIFAVNRGIGEPLPMTIELGGLGPAAVVDVQTVTSDDPRTTNGPGGPDHGVPVTGAATIEGGVLATTLPPVSWSAIRVKLH
jgi:alpha-N-arabinofuranosidase